MHDKRKLNVLRVFRRTVVTWLRNIVPFALLSVLIHSPVVLGIADGRHLEEPANLVIGVGMSVLALLTYAAITQAVTDQTRGRRLSLVSSLTVVTDHLVPLVILGLGAAVLFNVPNLFDVTTGPVLLGWGVVVTFFFLAVPVVVIEGAEIVKAVRRSTELALDNWLRIFVVVVVIGLVSLLVPLLAVRIAYGSVPPMSVWATARPLVQISLFAPLIAVSMVIVYEELTWTSQQESQEEEE